MARVGKYQALGRSLGQYKKTLYDVGAKEYQKQARKAEGEFQRGMYSAVGTTIANLAGIAHERAELKKLQPLDPGERPEVPIQRETEDVADDVVLDKFDFSQDNTYEEPLPTVAKIPTKKAAAQMEKIPVQQLDKSTQEAQEMKRVVGESAKQAGQEISIGGLDFANVTNPLNKNQVVNKVEDNNQYPYLGKPLKKASEVENQIMNFMDGNNDRSLMWNVTEQPGAKGAYGNFDSAGIIPNYNPDSPQVEKKTKDGWVPVNNEPSDSGIGGAIKGMESDKVFDMVKEGDEVNIFNPDGGTNGKDPKSAKALTDIEKHYIKEYGATIEGIDKLWKRVVGAESENRNIRQITTEDVKKKRVGKGGGTGLATGLAQVEPDRLKVGLQRVVNFSEKKGIKVPDWVVNAREKLAKGESFEAMQLTPTQQRELMLTDIAMRTGSDYDLNRAFETDSYGEVWFKHWHIGPVDQDENYKKDKLAYWNRKMGRG